MRQECDLFVKEAIAWNVLITRGKTWSDFKRGKCGASNRVSAVSGPSSVE